MKHFRPIMFLMVLSLFVGRLPAQSYDMVTFDESYTVSTGKALDIELDIDAGEVEVRPADSRDQVRVVMRYTEGEFREKVNFNDRRGRLKVQLDSKKWKKWHSYNSDDDVRAEVTVYLPECLPESIKDTVRKSGAELVEVREPVKICERAYSTGELGAWIKEQSLVIETDKGLVVITGCAHPGVVNVVREAKGLRGGDVHLVLGGFHLCWLNVFQIKDIIDGVKKEGVEMVAPCHCSGDLARSTFGKTYGENFILVGVGKRLEIEGE